MERPGNARSTGAGTLPITYFAYTGWIIAIVIAVTHVVRLRLGDRGWTFTWQLLAVGAGTAAYVGAGALGASQRSLAAMIRTARRRLSNWNPSFSLTGWLPGDRIRSPRVEVTSSLGKILSNASSFLDSRFRVAAWLPGRDGRRFVFGMTATVRKSLTRAPLWLAAGAYAVAAATLLALDHRRFLVIIAVLQSIVIASLRPSDSRTVRPLLGATCIAGWSLAAGLTYTHLSDWLLNGDVTSGLAIVAFTLATAIVLVELCAESSPAETPRIRGAAFAAAATCFTLFALRTDNFTADWVPLHRSYFADVAQLVRAGHWLLWDVPSLYGFLSILSLAVVPARDSWQALYLLTALFLIVQSCITFTILRWNRAGFWNVAFAIALPLAAFADNITRYAWSARLYPQGGLRFFWIVDLLFVAFLMYVWRAEPRRLAAVRWAGHAVWLVSLLWSFECGVWATVMWLPYVVVDALTAPPVTAAFGAVVTRLAQRCWPLLVLPVLAVTVLEVVYRSAIGTGPDWRSFVEFTGLFTSGKIRALFNVQTAGAAWCIILLLGAAGSLGIAAARSRRAALFRLLLATWLAVWSTASYYAVEPLDLYIALLLTVLVPAAAIVIFASREIYDAPTALFARISLAPLAIVCIAFMFGEPARSANIRMPLVPGWSLDGKQSFPPLSGELRALIARAKIEPTDSVLFPIGPYWTELRQGLILPFTRSGDGTLREYPAWLPADSAAPRLLYNALEPARRQTYVDRFLDRSNRAGWYITYREPADCSTLSNRLRTERTYVSTNFTAALCALARGR